MQFTFVHAADLHLDSPFCGLQQNVLESGADIGESLRNATFASYDALVRLCRERRATFLLIAGDVYDSADRSLRAQLRFRDGLATLSREGIPAFIVHGNHDPLDSRMANLEWPELVHVFGGDAPETVPVTVGGTTAATVTGMSFRTAREDRALAQGFVTPGDSPFRIALLHCNVGSATGHAAYAQCELGDLTAAGFDYWALGHVHEHRILSREPWVVYPGNIQGRSVRETGPRGCEVVQVDTDSHHVQSEFVPLDTVRWEVLSLDIAGLETLDQLDAALDQAIENAVAGASGRPLVLRIRCAGAGPLAAVLAADGDEGQGLLQRLRERNGLDREPFLWIERLVIRVRPPIDVAARRQGSDLLAMALRVAEETRCADTAEHRRLREELEALYGHSKAGKVLEDLSDTDIAALIEDAQILCAQLLEPETTTGD